MATYQMFLGRKAATVATKNYYTGGFAAAQRIGRGLGWCLIFVLMVS